MADLEKVIAHYQDVVEMFGDTNTWRFVRVDILKDAIALLKAQEPRVMTLEEIPEHDGAFLIEYRHEVWPMQWALFRLKLTTAYRFIRGDSELGFSISKDFYGKTWRCWTARPTDEQRKATPWEPPKEET